jgi:hypothetical protein
MGCRKPESSVNICFWVSLVGEQFDSRLISVYQAEHILAFQQRKMLMTGCRQSASMFKPTGWCLHVLTTLLFVFHIHYVQLHLLAETHLHDVPVAILENAVPDEVHHNGDHHDNDHHNPHPVSDHLVQAFAKHQPSFLTVVFLSSETAVFFARPDSQLISTISESRIALVESPPDPLQPRAPPLA